MPKGRMLIKQEVATYAQVLLDATKQAGNTFEVSAQLEEVNKVFNSHPDLRDTLKDTTLDAELRSNIVKELFKDYDKALVGTVAVMAQRCDMDLLHRVVEEFNNLVEETLNVVILDVTTVVELDDALRQIIKDKFATQFGKEIMLREHIDSSILGGIVLGAHGKRIDASVTSLLEQARVALSSVTTGGER